MVKIPDLYHTENKVGTDEGKCPRRASHKETGVCNHKVMGIYGISGPAYALVIFGKPRNRADLSRDIHQTQLL